jgi:hypothetical protein
VSARAAGKTTLPWQRTGAGSYRSSDARFEIGSDGPGRWYVRDTAERDELGLERTIGPFATLVAAKADAEARRGRAPEASPLEARLSERRSESRRRDAPPAARPPRPPTWLERLARSRPEEASRARGRIKSLERAGIVDAEAVVRRDIEADEPAVAEALLARSLGEAVRTAIDPQALGAALAGAAAPGAQPAASPDPHGLVTVIAERVLSVALDELTRGRREHGAASLPGWRLVEEDPEHPGRGRRMRIAGGDVPIDERDA